MFSCGSISDYAVFDAESLLHPDLASSVPEVARAISRSWRSPSGARIKNSIVARYIEAMGDILTQIMFDTEEFVIILQHQEKEDADTLKQSLNQPRWPRQRFVTLLEYAGVKNRIPKRNSFQASCHHMGSTFAYRRAAHPSESGVAFLEKAGASIRYNSREEVDSVSGRARRARVDPEPNERPDELREKADTGIER